MPAIALKKAGGREPSGAVGKPWLEAPQLQVRFADACEGVLWPLATQQLTFAKSRRQPSKPMSFLSHDIHDLRSS